MASNLFSRMLPNRSRNPSVYETLNRPNEGSETSDIEDRAGMAIDEQNLGEPFHDHDLDHMLADAAESQITSGSTALSAQNRKGTYAGRHGTELHDRDSRSHRVGSLEDQGEEDDEVPQSLLLERKTSAAPRRLRFGSAAPAGDNLGALPSPIPGKPTSNVQAQWETTRAHQPLYDDPPGATQGGRQTSSGLPGLVLTNPKEKAMWRWLNVTNLDTFLNDAYDYYVGKGIWSMTLARLFIILSLAFVVGFTVFLSQCIDYARLPSSRTLSDIVIPQCTRSMSKITNLSIWLFTFFWSWVLFIYLADTRRLWYLHEFYHHLLGIPDKELQTIQWQEVVARLMVLRDANAATAQNISAENRQFLGNHSKQRMDAHDIANRIMRKQNYLIAMFNKELLNLTLPIPFLTHRPFFAKTLEWYIALSVMDFVFDKHGQVRPKFLKPKYRAELVEGLRGRFKFYGFVAVLCAPITVPYYLGVFFLTNFPEFQKNPSQIASRSYTPLALWKFREFNELPHLFARRLKMSYPFASRYLDQFPKDKTVQLARFVAFIAGALAAVLGTASLLDPELFLGFEITPDRTVLFYITLLGSIWAVARGVLSVEEEFVFDPEYALEQVIEFTRYNPASWKGRLHTDEVRREFASLYKMNVVIFLEEVLSLVFTPFILWYSLPKCSERIVDFFREFSVHVDGLGLVCSFAVFDFQRGASNAPQINPSQRRATAADPRSDYYADKDGKMYASYIGFINTYATNQSPSRRRSHQPPPAFPGLSSQLLLDRHQATRLTPNAAQSTHLTDHRLHNTSNHPASPMHSILLDPHHQPPLTTFSRSPRATQTQRSRYLPPRPRLSEYAEEDEASLPRANAPASSSKLLKGGSSLGDSWETSRPGAAHGAGREESATEDEDEEGGQGEGVLGLISQFQRKRVADKGKGVDI